MTQRQNDTVVKMTRWVTLTQRQNDTVRHFGTVRHFDTEGHFGTVYRYCYYKIKNKKIINNKKKETDQG